MEKRPIILAVDDEDNILRLLDVNLSVEGYEVITINDSNLALEYFYKYQPDLLLLDLIMPGTGGFTILENIRKQSNVPIIILTALSDLKSIEHALVNGADDYVTKPFNIRLLSARVRARLKRSEMTNVGVAAN